MTQAAENVPAGRPLSADDVRPESPLKRLGTRVTLLETVDSTNAHLLEAGPRAPDGAVVFAEAQTAGRGRLGRRWEAPRGAGVLMSVRLHEARGSVPAVLGGVLASVAAVEAVAQACPDVAACVRWPNDVAAGGRKLGGVLVESRALADGRLAVVIGIGLNCLQQGGHFPAELRATATSLELESRGAVDRARVARTLLARLDAYVADPPGVEDAWRIWRSQSQDIGARVRLQCDGRAFDGVVLDVGSRGELVVRRDDGTRACFDAQTTTRLWAQT